MSDTRDIQAGDRYVRGDRYIEIISVTDTHVTYVCKGGMGVNKPKVDAIREFRRLEANTMANGCEFVPADSVR